MVFALAWRPIAGELLSSAEEPKGENNWLFDEKMKPFGLRKKDILRKNEEFQRVYTAGSRLYGDRFAVIYAPNMQQHSRLGISVQRKAGNAVRRNRIKRIIREVFRLNRSLFPRNADIVITVKPGFSANSYNDFYTMFSTLIHTQANMDAECNSSLH